MDSRGLLSYGRCRTRSDLDSVGTDSLHTPAANRSNERMQCKRVRMAGNKLARGLAAVAGVYVQWRNAHQVTGTGDSSSGLMRTVRIAAHARILFGNAPRA